MSAAPVSERRLSRRELLRRVGAVATLGPVAELLVACGDDGMAGPRPAGTSTSEGSPRAGESRPEPEVLLLHHAQGLTTGVRAFADELRRAGHTVHAPDLFDGRTFASLDQGIAYVGRLGFEQFQELGLQAAEKLPAELVYIGISLGVLPAQQLAQTRPGARGAVLLEACAPPSAFGSAWPAEVPVQVHGMAEDPYFAGEGDLDNARALVDEADDAQLFVYPGDRHLFTDRSLPSYDAGAARLVTKRVRAFLAEQGGR